MHTVNAWLYWLCFSGDNYVFVNWPYMTCFIFLCYWNFLSLPILCNLLSMNLWSVISQTVELPSVLWCCWLGGRKGIQPVKNWVVGCWYGCLSGVRWRFAYGPADATATHYCSSKSRLVLPFWYWLTQVVPDKIQKSCKMIVCVCVCVRACVRVLNWLNLIQLFLMLLMIY